MKPIVQNPRRVIGALKFSLEAARLTTVVVLATFLAILVLQSFLPWKLLVTTSGSMGHNVPLGAVTVVTHNRNVVPGDVIAFYAPNGRGGSSIYTHRLVYLDPQTGNISTIGDANRRPDVWAHPIPKSAIIGKVSITVPWLGYLVVRLNSLFGRLAYILLILELAFLPRAVRWALEPVPAPRHQYSAPVSLRV